MTFISYAQNYEDVMLHRALKDVDKGFYIDVGANDPVVDSVTKAFYDAGWRGINIEPVSEWFEKLQQDRPNDINLQLAVGARKGKINFYEVVGTGLSTMDESIAKRHVQDSGFELKKHKIPAVRLTTICEQYPHSDIHFLKIDVEGAELSVLQGLDLKKIRPWIILVESTLPNLKIENYGIWEHTLTERGYHYVYFDGLNRFYVADERSVLDEAFKLPPNYFDFYKRAREEWLERHTQKLQAEWDTAKVGISQMEESVKQAETTLQETEQQRHQLETHLQRLQVEAEQRNEKLHEKETKQQELILTLLEKENRLQEVGATCRNNKQQIEKLNASLVGSEEQRQVLKASLQETKQQRHQLETHLQRLQVEADQRDEKLHEKETKRHELLLSLIEKETRLQEVGATLTNNKQQIEKLYASLVGSEEQRQAQKDALQETKQQRQQLETQVQTLQAETGQLGKQLREKEESINCSNNEWEAAKHKIDELHQSNHHWWSTADQQTKDLEDARAKIDELNHSSHRWWLEADRLNKELQTIYGSKSWRITLPLRKLMQFFEWLFALPIRITLWLIRLPKRSARWLLVKAMAYTLKRPELKVRAITRLRDHPKLAAKLRQLAQAYGLTAVMEVAPTISNRAGPESSKRETVVTGNEASVSGEDLSHLTLSARRIYVELKVAISKSQKGVS